MAKKPLQQRPGKKNAINHATTLRLVSEAPRKQSWPPKVCESEVPC